MRSRRAEIIDQIRPPHRTPTPLDARRSVSSRARRRRAANGRAHARAAGGRAGPTSGPVPAAPRALTRVGRALGPIRRRLDRSIVGTGPRDEQADGVRDHAVVHRSLHITVARASTNALCRDRGDGQHRRHLHAAGRFGQGARRRAQPRDRRGVASGRGGTRHRPGAPACRHLASRFCCRRDNVVSRVGRVLRFISGSGPSITTRDQRE